MKKRKDEIAELVQHGRNRNALLSATTMQVEIRAAAERVARLSDPGTPERLLTLMAVADASGFSVNDIGDEIIRAKRRQRRRKFSGSPKP